MNVLFSFKQVQTFLTILVMMIFSFLDVRGEKRCVSKFGRSENI